MWSLASAKDVPNENPAGTPTDSTVRVPARVGDPKTKLRDFSRFKTSRMASLSGMLEVLECGGALAFGQGEVHAMNATSCKDVLGREGSTRYPDAECRGHLNAE